ncbi:hypothetical protein [endosymbiont of unidentified scaly snail isolate Monju]|uniref:hypothetical protein n=1 Tax=endosymbiont of unidentified scaly snail isolate Monju TaxID=1248727 RepID=UPI0014941136|nr:hypothetical protein [endosymbiont of unidentified scaly snail isolate Monju]
MGDLDRTVNVGVVTPVRPARDSTERQPGQRRQPRKGPADRATPRPRDDDRHKVDDYA